MDIVSRLPAVPKSPGQAIYIPDNRSLGKVLDNLPKPLRPYRENAALLVHFIATKQWMGDVDKRHGFVRLNSLILRQYIPGRQIKPIIDHLTNKGVFERDGYSSGRFASGYLIAPRFTGRPRRVVVTNESIAQKLAAWRATYKGESRKDEDGELQALINQRQPILDHMLQTLDMIGLDDSPDTVAGDAEKQGVKGDHARYITQALANRDHDGLKVDQFGHRVHSLVTRTASAVRGHVSINGQSLTELDVRNAQPLLLAMAIRNEAMVRKIYSDAQDNGSSPPPPLPLPVVSSGLDDFYSRCRDGVLYERFMEVGGISDRRRAKILLFKVIFGQTNGASGVTRAFARAWPDVFEWVQAVKKRNYKDLSRMLQRLESAVIIDGVCGRLVRELPDVRFVTVHDAALVVSAMAERVKEIIVQEFERYGVTPTIRLTRKGREP